MIPALCASALLQAGVIAALAEHYRAAIILVQFAAVFYAWRAAEPDIRTRSVRRALIAAAAAIVLTTTSGLFLGFGGDDPAGAGAGASKKAPQALDDIPAFAKGGIFRGVVLIPDAKPHAVLVPPLLRAPRDLLGKSRRTPFEIPFDGVYWLLQSPDFLPPKSAVTMRGTPANLAFRSTDTRYPLRMEARQSLGAIVDLQRCARIQIAILNADPFPGTVSLQLTLIDTSESRRISLGPRPVLSTFQQQPTGAGAQPVSELLSYNVPVNSPLKRFDEVAIRFHRAGQPVDSRSPRIAIERFVFIPR